MKYYDKILIDHINFMYVLNSTIWNFLGGCRSDSDCSGQHACLNRECVPACSPDGSSCGTGAVCYATNHHAVCDCPPGLTGDPHIGCVLLECTVNSDCPTDRACINTKCVSPCAQSDICIEPAECTVYNHKVDCSCPPGFIGDLTNGCKKGINTFF